MVAGKQTDPLDKSRSVIAHKVHQLRKERRWTQAELSRRLGLSQSRLSEIEQGDGSFTAEQFLAILRLFNVPVTHFAPAAADEGAELQNFLARAGAAQLQEAEGVLPTERLRGADDAVREVLVTSPSPRLITALAPVLVHNVDRVNLKALHLRLASAGLERRLAWVVENTLQALREELPSVKDARQRRAYTRAQVVLGIYEDFVRDFADTELAAKPAAPDVLDAGVRSKKTLAEVAAASSDTSKRWGIVTAIQPEDFARALRGARAAGA